MNCKLVAVATLTGVGEGVGVGWVLAGVLS